METYSSVTSRLTSNLALAALAFAAGVAEAATLTVTPSAVSNTYAGTITLQVTGLTNTEKVVVQKFLDLNTNGVIDAGDWLVQQGNIKDGQVSVFYDGSTAVTNLNLPCDLNSTTGAITVTLNFQGGDFMQNIVGKYLYKLSSPYGNFTPITNAFTVTNYPFAQKISGNVVNSGTNVPNAAVLLFSPTQNGPPLAGAIANNSGSYTIAMPTGTYGLVAFKTNYLCNFAAPAVVTLGGSPITTNLTVTNATASISGSVVDAGDSSKVLPGVMVMAQADNGFLTVGTTDTNGNFTLRVRSGQWDVKADDTGLIIHGYAGSQDATNVSVGTTGVMLAVPQATALFYGSVKDVLGNPLAGIDVYCEDYGNHQYETDGYTGTNGNYFAAVPAGDWNVQIGEDTTPTNYVFSGGQGFTLTSGQAVRWNFTALFATNHITGNVKVSGTNAVGVWVFADANISGTNFQTGADTDNSGNYWLNVAGSNTWTVGVQTGEGDHSLPGGYLCGNQTVVISNNNPVVNFTAILATNHITGHVQDSGGNPIPSLGVEATATINGAMYFVAAGTDGSGNYSLNVANTNWTVGVFCSGGPGGSMNNLDNILGPGNYQCPDNQSITISNNNRTVNFTVQLSSGVQILTTNLPDGQVNSFYDATLDASGGSGSFTWSLNDPQDFPPNLAFDSSGEISGTPTNSGTYTFTVHVDDGNGHTADTNLSLYIAPASAPLQVTTTSLPTGTNGVFYSQTLQASGGLTPYSWSLAPYSSSLPANLTLATNGVLSGTLATNGTFYFYARVTDGSMTTADSSLLQLDIVNPPLQITTVSPLPSGTIGFGYTNQLTASGGYPPYYWYLAAGSAPLPANLTLANSGLISGVLATNGTFDFLVQVTDFHTPGAPTKPLAILIYGKPVLGSPVWLTNRFQMRLAGATNQNYTVQMSTNLSFTNWTSLFITNNALTNSFIVADPNATNKQRFYRVKIGP